MVNKEKIIKGINACKQNNTWWCYHECPYYQKGFGERPDYCGESVLFKDILTLIREYDSTIGMEINTDGITFTATGNAKQGEERGITLGKSIMYDHIEKELLHADLLTDNVKVVLAKIKQELLACKGA